MKIGSEIVREDAALPTGVGSDLDLHGASFDASIRASSRVRAASASVDASIGAGVFLNFAHQPHVREGVVCPYIIYCDIVNRDLRLALNHIRHANRVSVEALVRGCAG